MWISPADLLFQWRQTLFIPLVAQFTNIYMSTVSNHRPGKSACKNLSNISEIMALYHVSKFKSSRWHDELFHSNGFINAAVDILPFAQKPGSLMIIFLRVQPRDHTRWFENLATDNSKDQPRPTIKQDPLHRIDLNKIPSKP